MKHIEAMMMSSILFYRSLEEVGSFRSAVESSILSVRAVTKLRGICRAMGSHQSREKFFSYAVLECSVAFRMLTCGKSPDRSGGQAERRISECHVDLPGNGKFNIAGLNIANIFAVAEELR